MNLKEFGEKVDVDDALDLAHVDVEERFVVVHTITRGLYSKILVDAIIAYTEEELFGYMHGKLDPRPLHHMTRIVGYYSELRNWNKSKLAELADRQKGDYGVSGAERKGWSGPLG